jgi:ketosteroid isomerase-like protein
MPLAFIAASACAPQDTSDYARDIEAINAMREKHVLAVNTKDIAANMADFTDDLVYLPPDQPPVYGKDSLTAFVEAFYAGFDIEIEMTSKEVVIAGEWAFDWGIVTGVVVPLEGGEKVVLDWKYLYVYQRQPDGSWKIARDIYNSNVSPNGTE